MRETSTDAPNTYARLFVIVLSAIVALHIFSIFVLAKTAKADGKHVIRVAQVTEGDHLSRSIKDILTAAYGELGYDVTFTIYPGERAIHLTNAGTTDAETYRINGLALKYPNIIQILVPILYAKHMLFTKTKGIRIEGWNSLNGYRVAYQIGYKAVEEHADQFTPVAVATNEAAFNLLNVDRVKFVIANPLIGLQQLKKLEPADIRMLPTPVATTPLFHYVNIAHKSLVPRLTEIFQRMKDDGTLRSISDRYERQVYEELNLFIRP